MRKAAEAILAARANANSKGRDPFFVAAKPGVYVPTIRQVGMVFSKEAPWVMTSTDDHADTYLDLDTKCPQCGGTRVRVRMEFEMTVDVEAGG